jgi:hypothetical protein
LPSWAGRYRPRDVCAREFTCWRTAERLMSTGAAEAKTVRIRADGPHVTDGAFSPAHQSIVGLDILDCDSLERAIEIALAHPMARGGVIEVRPFYDWDGEDGS